MKDVTLLTRDGVYVTTAVVPEYRVMPEVLLWGERYFAISMLTDVYHEVLCVAVLETKDRVSGERG